MLYMFLLIDNEFELMRFAKVVMLLEPVTPTTAAMDAIANEFLEAFV